MFNKKRAAACLGLWICLAAPAAWADLYQASAAYEKQDLPKAFELFRELAELGQPEAQENLAIMYVNGEGTKRDNVLGYAWATLALESGDREVARGIVAQLEPHLTDAARAKAGEVWSRFGRDALVQRVLPVERKMLPPPGTEPPCTMKSAANPDAFYPAEAKRAGMSGTVQVEVPIRADGSTRMPRVWYALPSGYFEDAGRAVAFASRYRPKIENGVAVDCTMVFRVKFTYAGGRDPLSTADSKAEKTVADLRAKALNGDPRSQLAYGIILSMRSEFQREEKPMHWFVAAAQAGVPAAEYLLGIHLMRGTAVEEDKPKGVFWLERAAKAGSGAAATALASYLLRQGSDVASREQGFDWMKRASETPHREGKLLFAALLVSWPDASRHNPALALKLIEEAALEYDPLTAEIRAAALAAQGDFAGAQRAEREAIAAGNRLRWDVASQQARLAAYEKGQLAAGELVSF